MLFAEDGKLELENMDQLIVSELETEMFTFAWKVKRFPQVLPKEFISPIFTSPSGKTEWSVHIRKCSGETMGLQSSVPCISIGLELAMTKTGFPITSEYTFYVLNSEMKLRKGPLTTTQSFTQVHELHRICATSATTFKDQTQGLMSEDGSLHLVFQVVTTTRAHRDQTPLKDDESQASSQSMIIQESFKTFLENGQFSDLTLSTKKSSFPVSKIVLAAQSPVFRAMFVAEMLESKENVVKIEDFSDETVKGFLEFLYTGQSGSLKENAVELLKMSEKYEVVPLNRECEKILMENLDKENAAELLILAHFYNSAKLKSTAITFVKKFRKEVAQTKSFQQLKQRHPEILLDLYSEFDKN